MHCLGLYYRCQCDHCALLGSQPHSKSTPLSARNWQMELGDGKLSELCILLNGTASNPWKAAVGAEECILDRYWGRQAELHSVFVKWYHYQRET